MECKEKTAVLNQQEEPRKWKRNEFFMSCRNIVATAKSAFTAIPDVVPLRFAYEPEHFLLLPTYRPIETLSLCLGACWALILRAVRNEQERANITKAYERSLIAT
jgi:hypothetical protein